MLHYIFRYQIARSEVLKPPKNVKRTPPTCAVLDLFSRQGRLPVPREISFSGDIQARPLREGGCWFVGRVPEREEALIYKRRLL